jgi:hypothetical protein
MLTDPDLGRTVHAATGRALGPDGHVADPVDREPPLWRAAREIAADYGGAFDVDANFGTLHAYWSQAVTGPGMTPFHYGAPDETEMRRVLDAAVTGTRWERAPEGAARTGRTDG